MLVHRRQAKKVEEAPSCNISVELHVLRACVRVNYADLVEDEQRCEVSDTGGRGGLGCIVLLLASGGFLHVVNRVFAKR